MGIFKETSFCTDLFCLVPTRARVTNSNENITVYRDCEKQYFIINVFFKRQIFFMYVFILYYKYLYIFCNSKSYNDTIYSNANANVFCYVCRNFFLMECTMLIFLRTPISSSMYGLFELLTQFTGSPRTSSSIGGMAVEAPRLQTTPSPSYSTSLGSGCVLSPCVSVPARFVLSCFVL